MLNNKGYKGEHYVFCRIEILVRYFFLTRSRHFFQKIIFSLSKRQKKKFKECLRIQITKNSNGTLSNKPESASPQF